MNVEDLINERPSFHHGGMASWSLSPDALRYIDRCINECSCTLETGAGSSTVLFAMKGAAHTSVTLASEEAHLIKTYCDRHDVSTARLTFLIGSSGRVLPTLGGVRLDFVLIDGAHSFPIPFLDWYYTAPLLAVGGYLLVDDVHLWTGMTLADFLRSESEWRMEASLERASVFRKVREVDPDKSWVEQSYVVDRSPGMLPELFFRKAVQSYQHGELRSAKREIAEVLHRVSHPENAPRSLGRQLAQQLLFLFGSGQGNKEVLRAGQDLSIGLPLAMRRSTMATLNAALATSSYREGNYDLARRYLLRAIALDWRYLTSRRLITAVLLPSFPGSQHRDPSSRNG